MHIPLYKNLNQDEREITPRICISRMIFVWGGGGGGGGDFFYHTTCVEREWPGLCYRGVNW